MSENHKYQWCTLTVSNASCWRLNRRSRENYAQIFSNIAKSTIYFNESEWHGYVNNNYKTWPKFPFRQGYIKIIAIFLRQSTFKAWKWKQRRKNIRIISVNSLRLNIAMRYTLYFNSFYDRKAYVEKSRAHCVHNSGKYYIIYMMYTAVGTIQKCVRQSCYMLFDCCTYDDNN